MCKVGCNKIVSGATVNGSGERGMGCALPFLTSQAVISCSFCFAVVCFFFLEMGL